MDSKLNGHTMAFLNCFLLIRPVGGRDLSQYAVLDLGPF